MQLEKTRELIRCPRCMPYRDDVDAQRTRLREVERELAELDVRLRELDDLADRRRALGAEAARLRQLLHLGPPSRRARSWHVMVVAAAGLAVSAGAVIAMVMITHPSSPPPPVAAPQPARPIQRAVHPVASPAALPRSVADSDCVNALAHPDAASETVLRACAASRHLGRCQLNDASTCTTCVCREYVGLDGACGARGCGEPLNGTGCAGAGFYRGVNNGVDWKCGTGDEAACMLRRMAEWGYCSGQETAHGSR